MDTVTIEDRYRAALTDLRLNINILIFENYPACCNGCASAELEAKYTDADYVYFINDQGCGLTWKDGKPYHFDGPEDTSPTRAVTKLYFNHSTRYAASLLKAAFEVWGLTVEWDGTEIHSVAVDFTK